MASQQKIRRLQIWDTNVYRRCAEGKIDPKRIKGSDELGLSPLVVLELVTSIDNETTFKEKQNAAQVALDHYDHMLPTPIDCFEAAWRRDPNYGGYTQTARGYLDDLKRFSNKNINHEYAKTLFSGKQDKKNQAYNQWKKDVDKLKLNIIQSPEFAKNKSKLESRTSAKREDMGVKAGRSSYVEYAD